MTNRLEKITRVTVIPGSPGMPGRPGVPYRPAYSYTVRETDCHIERVSTVYVTVPPDPMQPGSRSSTLEVPLGWDGGSARLSTRVCRTVTRTVHVPAQPYIPPRDPIPAKPEQVIYDFNLGWNAGAISAATAFGKVVYQFKVSPGANGIITGLTPPLNPYVYGYGEIFHAWEIVANHARVVESGTAQTAYIPLAVDDVLEVARIGDRIIYRINGVDKYTSSQRSIGPLWVDATLRAGGDAIVDAVLTSAVNSTAHAIGWGYSRVRALMGSAGGGFTSFADTNLAPLTGSAGGIIQVYGAGSFKALEGLAGDRSFYGDSRGALKALEGHGEAGLPQPAFAYGLGVMAPMLAAGHGAMPDRGESAGSLRPLIGLSADRAYGESKGHVLPLVGIGITEATYDGLLVADLPAFTCTAQGRGDETALIADIPAFSLEAYTAGRLDGIMAPFYLDATANDPSYDVMLGQVPAFSLNATGVAGSLDALSAQVPYLFTLSAHGGDVLLGDLPAFFGQSESIAGSVDTLLGDLPRFTSSAQSIAEDFDVMVAAIPSFAMLYGELIGELPLFVSSAHDITTAPARRVWVTNLRAEEMTQYLGYDFISVGRLGGSLYGLKADGLYLLGGSTDNGAQIAWKFVTAPSKFGTEHHKRVPYLYLGNARRMEIRPIVDEQTVGVYPSIDGRQRHRLNRGSQGVYWSFDVRGTQPAKVDGFEPLIEQLSRRV